MNILYALRGLRVSVRILAIITGLLVAGWLTIAAAAEERRHVLALYDANEPYAGEPYLTDIHTRLAMPLNRLGMVVDYHDVNRRPLPDPAAYRALVLWFSDDRMAGAEEFCRWLLQALDAGTRLIIIENFGADYDQAGHETPPALVEEVRNRFGLRLEDTIEVTANPFVIRPVVLKPEYFGFETRAPAAGLFYEHFVAVDTNLDVWCATERTDVTNSMAVAIAVGPRGGFWLASAYAYRIVQAPLYTVMWDLDPFAFLDHALDSAAMPRLDVTTVNGCRAAYSHFDSDGFNSLTQDLGPPELVFDVLRREVLERYPVPITAGIIAGQVDTNALGTAAMLAAARRVCALPNVQGSSHGYAHLYDWEEERPAMVWPGYVYSAAIETVGALRFVNEQLMPSGRVADIVQWTGNCLPTEESLALCEQAGALNINGGDTRYDRLYRSVSFIRPLTRSVGPYRQVYTSAQNDNLYTDLWTANFGGYRNVIQTFEHSETPRRLPVNVYYHAFSAERQASLDALKAVYEWCLAQPLCWIETAEYIRMVRSFMAARVGRMETGGYWVEDYAPCCTVRLDDCDKNVAMAAAQNVWGFTHHAGSLYVTLAPAARAEFSLTAAPPTAPCLRRSTALLRNVRATATTWAAEARLYAPGFIELQGLAPGATVTARQGDQAVTLVADAAGRVPVPLPAGRGEWVEVTVGP